MDNIKLIIAPPAEGKTTFCINKIIEIRNHDPLAAIQVIVPNPLTISIWKEKLAHSSMSESQITGTLGIKIETFDIFSRRILDSALDSRPTISSSKFDSIVHEAIIQTNIQQPLEYFGSIHSTYGFVSELCMAFARYQQENISPDILANEASNQKERDVARIYSTFDSILHQQNLLSPYNTTAALWKLLSNQPHILPSNKLLILDGFETLCMSEMLLLSILESSFSETLITIACSDDPDDIRYKRSYETRWKLDLVLQPNYIELSPCHQIPTEIEYLRNNLFSPYSKRYSGSVKNIKMIEAFSQAEEIREDLRWIKTNIVRCGLRPNECIMIIPDQPIYWNTIRSVAQEMGIPVHLTNKRPLSEHPSIAAILSLYKSVEEGFPVNKTIAILKKPFLSGFFQSSDLELLQKSAIQNSIISFDQWDQSLLSKDLYEKVDAFLKLFPESGKNYAYADLCNQMYDLLIYFHFEERLGKDDKYIMQYIKETVKVLSEKSRSKGTLHEFIIQFSEIIAGYAIKEKFEPNSVYVCNYQQSREKLYKATVISGLSEDLIPNKKRDDLILSEEFCKKHSIYNSDSQITDFLFALTRAKGNVLISRPRNDDTGEEWTPSIYWTEILHKLPEPYIPEKLMVNKNVLSDAASPMEERFLSSLEKGDLSVFYKNRPSDMLNPALIHRWSIDFDQMSHSPTEILTYYSCPFRYYVKYILKIDELPQPQIGITPSVEGNIYHQLFEETFKTATNSDDMNSVLANLDQIADNIFQEAPDKNHFLPTPFWEKHEIPTIKHNVRESIINMFTKDARKLHTIAMEVPYDFSFTLKNGVIRLAGRIDRIETRDSILRIIDFKRIDPEDNYQKIQLLINAAACVRSKGLSQECDGVFWIYKKHEQGTSVHFPCGTELEDWLQNFSDGVKTGCFPQKPYSHCPSNCAARNWCPNFIEKRY